MPRPTDLYGDELRPVALYDSSGLALRAGGLLTPFNALAIRDTQAHTAVVDCTRLLRKVVAVVNTLDQAVTVTLAYSLDPTVATAVAAFTSGVSVPAGATRYFAAQGGSLGSHVQEARLDNYMEGLVVTLQCSVAPASGTVSVHVLRYAF